LFRQTSSYLFDEKKERNISPPTYFVTNTTILFILRTHTTKEALLQNLLPNKWLILTGNLAQSGWVEELLQETPAT
jgi:hypothetical protein